jgi:hypothetical protein
MLASPALITSESNFYKMPPDFDFNSSAGLKQNPRPNNTTAQLPPAVTSWAFSLRASLHFPGHLDIYALLPTVVTLQ